VETHHVSLPDAFIEHVRRLNHRMPTITVAQFAPHYDETMPLVGWASAVPWRWTATTLVPEPPRAAAAKTPDQDRPHGSWGRPRKPRKPPKA
jgi:hypothetical protein